MHAFGVHDPGGHWMITLTPVAGDKLKDLIATEADPGAGLRVKVIPGGCSGLAYSMTFDMPSDDDEVVEQHGVQVIVDRLSVPYLLGAEFDYEEGFQGAGFRINNPNSTGSCGCGKSFTA
jgi:iron-sulfur cluster assembly accessory protein